MTDKMTETFDFKTKCRGHPSTILHIDFTEDGKFLHSNSTSYDLLFWDASTGKHLTSGASQFCDEN